MRPLILLCLYLSLSCQGFSQSQETSISVDFKDLSLALVLDTISAKSDFNFSYNSQILPTGSLFTLKRTEITVPKLLDQLLVGTKLKYKIIDDQIILNAVKETLESYPGKHIKNQVSGWAKSKATNEPIAGVNVFINGTTIGTTTDQNGYYQLPKIDNGTHLLIFSYVGYESMSYSIEITDKRVFQVNSLMYEKISELDDVEITAQPIVSEDDVEKYLKEFKQEFLGSSINSRKCFFQNPEVLSFTQTEGNHLASVETKESLIVINEALGYKIGFDLEYFEKDSGMTNFHAKARFENLSTNKASIRKKWKQNREVAYRGSLLHFFRSLVNNTTQKEGFIIQRMVYENDMRILNPKTLLSLDSTSTIIFNTDIPLKITYMKEYESQQYLDAFAKLNLSRMQSLSELDHENLAQPGFQTSYLEVLKEEGIRITSSGKVLDPKELRVSGYLSWERISDLVPLDYDPKKRIQSNK